jgi:hypothetical protein
LAVFFSVFSFAHADVIMLNAEYSVPTLIANELKVNTFALQNYQVETFPDGNAVMKFKLPKTMVGHDQHKFELKLVGISENSTKILSSPNAKAVCQGPWVNMNCSIAFTKLALDKKELKQVLQQDFGADEANVRLKLLIKFNTDPIGTVKVFVQ